MKKVLFQLLDTILAGLIFFLISYGFFEYTMNSGNGALITSLTTTLLFCFAYYTLRKLQRQKSADKQAALEAQRTLTLQFRLMSPVIFQDFVLRLLRKEYAFLATENSFPLFTVEEGAMAFMFSNAPKGPPVEDVLTFVQSCSSVNSRALTLVSVSPPEQDCQLLLEQLNTTIVQWSVAELQQLMEKHKITLPENSLLKKPQRKTLSSRFKAFTQSPYFTGFAFKYGLLLLIWSLIAHYKVYYLCSGALLLSLGIYATIKKRRLQSKKIF